LLFFHLMNQFKWLWVCPNIRKNLFLDPKTKKIPNAPSLSYALCVRLLTYLPETYNKQNNHVQWTTIEFLGLWDHQEPILKISAFIENNLI